MEFPGTLDLSTAILTLSQLLNEASGNGELAHRANGANLVPLTLQVRPGGTATRATFETPPGTEPAVRVEVNQRNPKKGKWEFSLTAEQALIGAAAGCDAGASKRTGEVTTQFTLSDGTHFPLTVAKTQPWLCKKGELKAP